MLSFVYSNTNRWCLLRVRVKVRARVVPAAHGRGRSAIRMGWDGMGWDEMGWDGMG